ncbi:MAG: long-chain-fatty-acid--CoA ligase [Pseudomonadota bacterium]
MIRPRMDGKLVVPDMEGNAPEGGSMLSGLMMHQPLLVSSIIDYARDLHGHAEIVSARVEGDIHRTTYPEIHKRICRLAHGLRAMGIGPGDRVATLAWNGYRHFELYYAIAGIGAVCHTINPRLSAEQFTYIVNHAGDTALFFDTTFTSLAEALAPGLPADIEYVAMCDADALPDSNLDLKAYESLLEGQPETIDWPELDENTACALCYTSGTTGDPKGVLYSNRAMVLHSLFVSIARHPTFFQGSRILPVVPLFHANAWGLPYVAPLCGCSLVFPGPKLDGPSVFDLMESEQVNSSWGVPTVWLGVLNEMKARGEKPSALAEILSGGSAVARTLIEEFSAFGIEVGHGWGMTEMSPVGTLSILSPEMKQLDEPAQIDLISKQGRRMFGVDMKIVDEDGKRLPEDDEAEGELLVRGNGIAAGYYENEDASDVAVSDGWFRTGDVARISPDGWLTLTDRAKDLIKSGGEWISSIDVENTALAHPGVANCAVIAVPHPKWDERPLLVVQKEAGADPSPEELRAHVGAHLAKWQVPDAVEFVDDLPLTATGKVSKRTLREQLKDHPIGQA